MLSLPHLVQIFLAVQPADMRRSFDGLVAQVRDWLGQDPLSGHLFVFRSKRGDRVKILFWDRDGLVLYYKRLEKGSFRFPTPETSETRCLQVSARPFCLSCPQSEPVSDFCEHSSSGVWQVSKSVNSVDRVLWLSDNLGTVRDLAKNDGTTAGHYKYNSSGHVISGNTSLTRYLDTSREYDPTTELQYNYD